MPRLDINLSVIAKARRDARPGEPEYEVIDTRAPGLRLRVGPRGVRWGWKIEHQHRTRRMDLGAVEDWSVEEARTVAMEATKLVRERRGLADIAWLAAQRARFGKAPEPTAAVDLPQPYKPVRTDDRPWKPVAEVLAWGYRTAVERYIAEVRDVRRKATAEDYRKTLTHPAFKELMYLPVSLITVDAMQKIIDGVAKGGHHTSAVGMVIKQKTFFKWLARPAIREKTFVKADAMVLLEKPQRSRAKAEPGGVPSPATKKRHFPLMPELGRLVALARSGALDPAYDLAILLLVLAAPRNHAVVSAAIQDFAECEEEPGWGVWRIPALHRKGASDDDERDEVPHAIPVPPAVWSVIKERIDGLQGQHWLFPGFRPRRRGMPVGHMSEHTLSHQFDALPGIVAGPHDLRRALRTQGRKLLRVTPKELSLILDHAEGRAGSVTQTHYSDDEELDVKRPILERWWDLVEKHAAAAAPGLPTVEEIRAHVSAEIRRQKGRPTMPPGGAASAAAA